MHPDNRVVPSFQEKDPPANAITALAWKQRALEAEAQVDELLKLYHEARRGLYDALVAMNERSPKFTLIDIAMLLAMFAAGAAARGLM